ncbi:MAG: RNA methyltransferase [Candidatus Moranbacteria bacterium]|nr:RNA methyltransferase [Candidatus Moranbacteria bacterium]
MKKELFLILHNIRSAYNVGAIFRTADGAGVAKIFLTGYSHSPSLVEMEAAKSKADKMIEKTALGAEKTVPWEKYEDVFELLEKLKKENCLLAALEVAPGAVELGKFESEKSVALILGNEVTGVPEEILEKCDLILAIPMRGTKGSLNVSIAAGIAAYQIMDKIIKEV